MENDIVLSDEMNELRILALPPFLPTLRKKFLSIGDITDRGIEPYIEHLSVRSFHRYRNAPVKVTAHRTWLKTSVNPALALAINIAPPLLMSFKNPLRKPLFILIQRQIPMLGLLLHKLAAAESRLRIDQFIRAEGSAALLALVAVCSLRTAARAGTCNISVSKEGLGLLVIILLAHLLDELALII